MFVETEDWRKDLEASWTDVDSDEGKTLFSAPYDVLMPHVDGWVYTNEAWMDPLSAPKARTRTHPNSEFNGAELRSNGTHDFKRTVLIFSIDGLRRVLLRCVTALTVLTIISSISSADYLDRGLTPHLLDVSKKGLRAKYMKPIFPVRSHILGKLLRRD